MPKKFEELKCGDFAEFKHIISKEDVQKFVELTGDDNPLHVDKSFADKTPFKGIVTHGMLSASFVSTMIGKHLPGDGALWVSQSFEFLLPVRIGDELYIFSEIIEKNRSQKLLTLRTKITNQYKQIVLQGVGVVKALQADTVEIVTKENDDSDVVIITGSGKGIGAATAEYLARKKYKVVINYAQDRESAESIATKINNEGGQAFTYQADVRDFDAVKNMVRNTIQNFGTVSALVHGASSKIIPNAFDVLEWNDIQNNLDIHLKGAFNCVQAVLDEFCKKKSGAVVMLGTIAADNVPPQKWTSYTIAKAALSSLTKSLALEYGHLGIRFNIVSPGMTETSLIADVPEKARLLSKMQTPLRKLAQPYEIASAIAFLLSKESSHITGENLRVCGGIQML